ncbi:hypothetical protein, partial [Escherichia coli]|uniref:hypothetical protein n=1 Tax=Escherichia coli TaxID=562 RepID=UPI00102DD98D
MRRGSDAIALSKERSRLALRLAGLRLVRSIYAGWRHTELNPKTWTVSVNRLFDTQSGILPG